MVFVVLRLRDRARHFQVWVGSTSLAQGTDWSTACLTLCFTDVLHTQGSGPTQYFTCSAPVTGRYAYLFRPSMDCLNLAEIYRRSTHMKMQCLHAPQAPTCLRAQQCALPVPLVTIALGVSQNRSNERLQKIAQHQQLLPRRRNSMFYQLLLSKGTAS